MKLGNFLRHLVKPFFKLFYKIKIVNDIPITNEENCVFVANHKSLLDPVILYIFLPKPIRFMAKKELFKNSFFAKFLYKIGAYPVSRGNNDISAIKNSLKFLKNNDSIGIFPQGTRVNEDKDYGQAKAGAVLIASKAKVPLVSVAIKGKYSFRSKIEIVFIDKYVFEDRKYSLSEIENISDSVFQKIINCLEEK